jgi:hypothetical protein
MRFLQMNPAILNLSLDHHARDTQYLTPQTNISSTSHSTESAETYGIGSVSLVCVFHLVPAAFSLGAPVFIVLLALPTASSLALQAPRMRTRGLY